jgi:GDP-D-mannose dehydratase
MSPYAVAKLSAFWLVNNYLDAYNTCGVKVAEKSINL